MSHVTAYRPLPAAAAAVAMTCICCQTGPLHAYHVLWLTPTVARGPFCSPLCRDVWAALPEDRQLGTIRDSLPMARDLLSRLDAGTLVPDAPDPVIYYHANWTPAGQFWPDCPTPESRQLSSCPDCRAVTIEFVEHHRPAGETPPS